MRNVIWIISAVKIWGTFEQALDIGNPVRTPQAQVLRIPWLEQTGYRFPDVETAMSEPDGLLAASQCLYPALIIDAYQHGIFPWYSDEQPVLWWSPDPRCVIFPDNFHISRRFRRTLNQQVFTVKTNTAFRQVMLACAAPRKNEAGSWITGEMLENYCQLHKMGIAHSIECWHREKLVGGLYGLKIGDVFFGESMFSRMKDASKVAMHYICTQIKPVLLDAQVQSDHLMRMGAEVIPRPVFIHLLNKHAGGNLSY